MADFFQNLDPASAFNLNPSSQPVVSHLDPATLDAGLQHLAELGVQVGLPLGLGALGGPMSLGLRTLGPAITAAILGPNSPPPRMYGGLPMLEGAIPNPEQAELTAAQVLAEAASKNGPSYAQWQAKNPGAEEGMFDFQNAKPAMEGACQTGVPKPIGTQIGIPFLAQTLSQIVGQPILDQTGLTGKYDFELRWAPDQGSPNNALGETLTPQAPVDSDRPNPHW